MKLVTLLTLVLAPLLLLTGARPARSYVPTDLCELTLLSDFVVVGKIEKLEGDNLWLTVDRNLAGSPPEPGYLVVPKFRDWTCAMRFTEYKVGQQCVFFLQRPRRDQKKPKPHGLIMGAADEGELPIFTRKIKGEDVEHAVLHGSRVTGLEPRSCKAFGAELRGTEVTLEDLTKAVRGAREHFEVKRTDRGFFRSIREVSDKKTVEAYAKQSVLSAHLVEKIREVAKNLSAVYDE